MEYGIHLLQHVSVSFNVNKYSIANMEYSSTVVDCGPLNFDPNGQVVASGTTFMSVAVYGCGDGYTLEGVTKRDCQADGMWSAVEPTCERE